MTGIRLRALNNMESQIKRLDVKVLRLKSDDFKMHHIVINAFSRTESLTFDEQDEKLASTIYEMLLVYYEKKLAILKKRFEVL